MSTNSLIAIANFSGSSTYATSFGQVLSRAVQIASLPGELIVGSMNELSAQQGAMTGLLANFAQLQGAIQSVNAASSGNISAAVSDRTILSASAAATANPGTYTVTVDNLGAATTAISQAAVPPITDPTLGSISNSTTYTLKIGGVAQPVITPTGGSLQDLADAINAANQGVQATIINVGGSSGNDYRLALTSTSMSSDAIELDDASNSNLIGQMSTGSAVQYKVNGGADISTNTRSVTIAPGVTANFLDQAPSNPVTITVSHNENDLSNALTGLVSAYNNSVDALAAQRGQSGGALVGQSIVTGLQSMLSGMSHFDGSGKVLNLNDFGLTVDKNGKMQFDSVTFSGLSGSDIQEFLGSSTTNGFLKFANDALNSATDSTTGSLTTGAKGLQDQITLDQSKIADEADRVTNLQTSLLAQLAKADAAIANLEGQKNFFIQLFQATYGTNTASK